MTRPPTLKYPIDKIQCVSCNRWLKLNDNIRLRRLINQEKTIFQNGGDGSEDKLRETYRCRKCIPRKKYQRPTIKVI